jgi:hypothetical protein
MRVAYLTASSLLVAGADRPAYHHEHTLQVAALREACAQRGIDLVPQAWDDEALLAGAWSAFVVGTTWDYTARPAAFLAALSALAEVAPLLNPLPVVRWNLEKAYLRELEGRGVPVVPTLWRARADARTVAEAHAHWGTDEIVVKPAVGAGAWRQVRLRRGQALPASALLPPGACLLQPYLASITTEGELSYHYLGGTFSHAVRKLPAHADYRIQSHFGGRNQVHAPTAEGLALGQRVLEAVPHPLLHARADFVRGTDGRLALIELELIEPYLYPEQGPDLGPLFATALARALGC